MVSSMRSRQLIAVFALGFLVSVSPVLIRAALGIPGIIGFPTYYHQRITGYILSGFDWYDPLSFGGRPYTYPPFFSFMLAGFALPFGLELGGFVMMGVLGGITALLCFLLAQELIGNGGKKAHGAFNRRSVFLVVLASSPAFIFLFSHLSTRSPPIVLGLLAIYLVLKKRPWWMVSLPLALSIAFHPETGLLFSFLAMIADKKYLKNLRFVALALLLTGIFYVPFYLTFGLPQANALHSDYAARNYGLESLNIPFFAWETSHFWNGPTYDNLALGVLMLSLFGLWKSGNPFLRKWFLISFVLALVSTRLLMYLVFPAAMLAVTGIYMLAAKYKKYGRFLFLGFLAYSIIIGSMAAYSFGTSWPAKSQTEALLWIKGNTPENATVLSDWAHGHWITGIAYRKSFVDGYAEYAPQADQRMAGLKLFYQNCTVPEGYGIRYAYLEDWFIRQQNITCLDQFEKVYDKNQIYVYRLA